TGDIFVGDFANSRVVKISPAGVQTTLYSGAILPGSVVVDAAGNVFFLDLFNWQIKEIPAQGGTPILIANVSVSSGTGDLALDAVEYLSSGPAGQVLHSGGRSELAYTATVGGSTRGVSPKPVTVANTGTARLRPADLQ